MPLDFRTSRRKSTSQCSIYQLLLITAVDSKCALLIAEFTSYVVTGKSLRSLCIIIVSPVRSLRGTLSYICSSASQPSLPATNLIFFVHVPVRVR